MFGLAFGDRQSIANLRLSQAGKPDTPAMQEWWNGRHATLRKSCPGGVKVQILSPVPMICAWEVNVSANYINHIALVLDASDSMHGLSRETVQVADDQIKYLAESSKRWDQETRATVYTFNTEVRCVYYDKDVLRLPSVRGSYRPNGMTALVDATLQAIDDLKQTATLYGDHAFLVYVLTDGQENRSRRDGATLERTIRGLPDNWTMATLVPNQKGVEYAEKFGFPSGNIQIWETTSRGMQEVGDILVATTDSYMQARTQGIRSSNSLFSLDTSNLRPEIVKTQVPFLSNSDYRIYPVTERKQIRDFVEQATGRPYVLGNSFYEITKTEEIQPQKKIAVRDKKDGQVFMGNEARQLLNLPPMHVKVGPGYNPNYDVFVQSTSVNRKLVPGTELLILQ